MKSQRKLPAIRSPSIPALAFWAPCQCYSSHILDSEPDAWQTADESQVVALNSYNLEVLADLSLDVSRPPVQEVSICTCGHKIPHRLGTQVHVDARLRTPTQSLGPDDWTISSRGFGLSATSTVDEVAVIHLCRASWSGPRPGHSFTRSPVRYTCQDVMEHPSDPPVARNLLRRSGK